MFGKENLKVVGNAMLDAAKYQVNKPEFYLITAATVLGVGLGRKSTNEGIKAGVNVAIGIVGYTGLRWIPRVTEPTIKSVSKVEDI